MRVAEAEERVSVCGSKGPLELPAFKPGDADDDDDSRPIRAPSFSRLAHSRLQVDARVCLGARPLQLSRAFRILAYEVACLDARGFECFDISSFFLMALL